MRAAANLLQECTALGIGVTALKDGDLWIDPIDKLPSALRVLLIQNKPDLIACLTSEKRLHVHRVLTRLNDIRPYRADDSLLCHGDPTPEQRQLMSEYRTELLEALRPRALTDCELEQIALFAYDNNETTQSLLNQVGQSPAERVALLWMATGSPGAQGGGQNVRSLKQSKNQWQN